MRPKRLLILINSEKYNKKKRKIQLVSCPGSQSCYYVIRKADPETKDGTIILMTHFISQSAPDIRKKLKRLENGPQTSQAEILNVAFKVDNYQEEQQRADKERRDRMKFQTLAQAL
jgi:predicted nucleotide-binding protein (sugar kinase/HSP70/actin superfamily)